MGRVISKHCFRFTGIRFAQHTRPDDIILIYDYNGYVAGVQAVIEKSRLVPGIYDYANNPEYQEGTFFGHDVSLAGKSIATILWYLA